MKELYLIMRELLEVEYNQKSLLYIMEMLETAYNEGERECSGLEDNSMTQQRVADLLHIGQRTYADYESGKTRIPVDYVIMRKVLTNRVINSKLSMEL